MTNETLFGCYLQVHEQSTPEGRFLFPSLHVNVIPFLASSSQNYQTDIAPMMIPMMAAVPNTAKATTSGDKPPQSSQQKNKKGKKD